MDNSDGLIESSTWKDYFKNLNSIEPSRISLAKSFLEQFKSIQIPENCVLDQHFSLNEIRAACQELKNKKSGGADGLLNEMLKYDQFILFMGTPRAKNSKSRMRSWWWPLSIKTLAFGMDSGKMSFPADLTC